MIKEKNVPGLVLSVVLSSLIGSRLFYVLANLNSLSFAGIFKVWEGGLFGIGALIGGILGVFAYAKKEKLSLLKTADFFVPFAALSFALIRIGCFLRGCCFGKPTDMPWGILYSNNSLAAQAGFSVPLHPTQIYAVLANLLIFFILIKTEKNLMKNKNEKNKSNKSSTKDGFLFLLFLVLFSFQRFLIDFLRYYPASEYVNFFNLFQLSIFQRGYFAVFVFSLIFLIARSKRARFSAQ